MDMTEQPIPRAGRDALDPDTRWQVSEVLSRFAHMVDNGEWPLLPTVTTPPTSSSTRGRTEQCERGASCTSSAATAPLGSGDYQDTLVKTADGWRIAERDVSRSNRLDTDPTGGGSTRTFSVASWIDEPRAD
jgi:hypothetical protein